MGAHHAERLRCVQLQNRLEIDSINPVTINLITLMLNLEYINCILICNMLISLNNYEITKKAIRLYNTGIYVYIYIYIYICYVCVVCVCACIYIYIYIYI